MSWILGGEGEEEGEEKEEEEGHPQNRPCRLLVRRHRAAYGRILQRLRQDVLADGFGVVALVGEGGSAKEHFVQQDTDSPDVNRASVSLIF